MPMWIAKFSTFGNSIFQFSRFPSVDSCLSRDVVIQKSTSWVSEMEEAENFILFYFLKKKKRTEVLAWSTKINSRKIKLSKK